MIFDSQGFVAIISALGGIAISYIAYLGKKSVDSSRQKQPKDPVELVLDGYERLLQLKTKEDERKDHIIQELGRNLEELQDKLSKTSVRLDSAMEQLQQSKTENANLQDTLTRMRKDYNLQNGNV